MDQATLQLILTGITASCFGIWILNGFLLPITGQWVRDHEEGIGTRSDHEETEQFYLSHFGPFVYGEGHRGDARYEYGGWILGRTIFLHRRDHGVQALMEQGFPKEIAKRREGQIQAKLRLNLERQDCLTGSFIPRKVEFTHNPPRVVAVIDLHAQPRLYKRVDKVKTEVGEQTQGAH